MNSFSAYAPLELTSTAEQLNRRQRANEFRNALMDHDFETATSLLLQGLSSPFEKTSASIPVIEELLKHHCSDKTLDWLFSHYHDRGMKEELEALIKEGCFYGRDCVWEWLVRHEGAENALEKYAEKVFNWSIPNSAVSLLEKMHDSDPDLKHLGAVHQIYFMSVLSFEKTELARWMMDKNPNVFKGKESGVGYICVCSEQVEVLARVAQLESFKPFAKDVLQALINREPFGSKKRFELFKVLANVMPAQECMPLGLEKACMARNQEAMRYCLSQMTLTPRDFGLLRKAFQNQAVDVLTVLWEHMSEEVQGAFLNTELAKEHINMPFPSEASAWLRHVQEKKEVGASVFHGEGVVQERSMLKL